MSPSIRKVVYGIPLFGLLLTLLSLVSPTSTHAVTGANWKAGNIIDDGVFYNNNDMSVADIQNFLNSKVTCDTWGTKPSEWGGGTRAQYGASRGYPAPYTCLKDYSQDGKSAAQIIKEAADTYRISSKSLIVLLQKEQALVTDEWPWPVQYRSATGYGCPDTAPCDAEYYGFRNQVMKASYQFRRYATYPSEYLHKPYQNNSVRFNPNAGCGSTSVYIENLATAGLYNYTPHQPNASALDNLYGSGDSCGAYGNRNFWRLFNDWFGSTHGSGYSWSIESFLYSGGDNILNKDELETVTLRARNTGKYPWDNHGNNPVRIGTWQPINRSSNFASSNWLAPYRPSTLVENSVAPGDVGTFTFQLNPKQLGTFVEGFNLVAENATWMDWPGFSPTVQVSSGYTWNIQNVIYEKGTGLMEPGTTQLITLIAKNTGNTTWSKSSGPSINLGTWQPERKSLVGQGWLSQTRVATMNENTVAPGQTAGFQFTVRMPSTGIFYERLNLVAEGQAWFNDSSLTLYLDGGKYAWQPTSLSHSTGTANIVHGTNFTLTVKAKNTGTMPWRKLGNYPVRIGTASPLNRGTALYSNTWIRDTRPTGLLEEVVNPGQEGTFTFSAKSPDNPGPYNERFTLLAEGLTWFNDPGFSIYVNSY